MRGSVFVGLLGHVAEWLRRGLQILTISTDQHTLHSKVPVKESIVLKFILQVLSVGYWWATAEIPSLYYSVATKRSYDTSLLLRSFRSSRQSSQSVFVLKQDPFLFPFLLAFKSSIPFSPDKNTLLLLIIVSHGQTEPRPKVIDGYTPAPCLFF